MRRATRKGGAVRFGCLVACLAVLLVAAPAEAAKKPAPKPPLQILLTNDDGVAGEGLDAIAKALGKRKDVVVTIVAPATEQSGTGGKTTPGKLSASRSKTKSGIPATAVKGFPADSVRYALETVFKKRKPDLVISGINSGANLGPVIDLSGTVGAARAGARAGLPALATSQGFGTPGPDFKSGVKMTLAWLAGNRAKLKRRTVFNLNTPTCSEGTVHGTGPVLVATSATSFGTNNPVGMVNCNATGSGEASDVEAFYVGFAPVVKIPLEPAAP